MATVVTAVTPLVVWLEVMVVSVVPVAPAVTLKPSWPPPLPLVTRAMAPQVAMAVTVWTVAQVVQVAPLDWPVVPSEPRVRAPWLLAVRLAPTTVLKPMAKAQ